MFYMQFGHREFPCMESFIKDRFYKQSWHGAFPNFRILDKREVLQAILAGTFGAGVLAAPGTGVPAGPGAGVLALAILFSNWILFTNQILSPFRSAELEKEGSQVFAQSETRPQGGKVDAPCRAARKSTPPAQNHNVRGRERV